MILLDLGRRRSEMKHVWRAKRVVLICLICCTLKCFSDPESYVIMMPLAGKGLEIVKEGMVIFSLQASRNSQTGTNHP